MTFEQKIQEIEDQHEASRPSELQEDWVYHRPFIHTHLLLKVLRRAIEQRNNWSYEAIKNNSDIAVQESDEFVEYHQKDDDIELLAILNGKQ